MTQPTAPAGRSLDSLKSFDWRAYIIYIGLAIVFILFAILLRDTGFLTPNNLLNIVRQTAIIAIMAVAMTFVIGAGQIDLSVGAMAGLASVTTALSIGPWVCPCRSPSSSAC